jgi:hypothetical protein
MAPPDRIRLPLRWEFVPRQRQGDGAIQWQWRAYAHSGQLSMQCEGEFETLTDCMRNAREHGYGAR